MPTLSERQCKACHTDATAVSHDQQQSFLKQLPDWQIITINQVPQLHRQFTFKNFADAMVFANQVAEIAEHFNHHPCIIVEWGRCEVKWWTHSIKGLHENDFILAAKTGNIVCKGAHDDIK